MHDRIAATAYAGANNYEAAETRKTANGNESYKYGTKTERLSIAKPNVWMKCPLHAADSAKYISDKTVLQDNKTIVKATLPDADMVEEEPRKLVGGAIRLSDASVAQT